MAYFNKFRSTIGPGKVYGQLGCQFPKNMFFCLLFFARHLLLDPVGPNLQNSDISKKYKMRAV